MATEINSPLGTMTQKTPTPRVMNVANTPEELAELEKFFNTPFDESLMKEESPEVAIPRLKASLKTAASPPPPPPAEPPLSQNSQQVKFDLPSLNKEEPRYLDPDFRKNRLKAFLNMSEDQTVIEISGVKIAVRTLYSWEQREVNQIVNQYGNNLMDLQVQTLARAILSFDDIPFSVYIGSENTDEKARFLYNYNNLVIGAIFGKYVQFGEELRQKYLNRKDPIAAMLEVAEEIKKAQNLKNGNS